MDAAFIPEVNDELDTQNFEKFEEVSVSFIFSLMLYSYLSKAVHLVQFFSFSLLLLQSDIQAQSSSRAGPWRKVIVGFTFSLGNCHQVICRISLASA